jgi:small nuclear ribonucleoprotein
MSGRPLDVLEASIDEEVTVRLKGGEIHYGALVGYDQHMNVVLEPSESEEAPTEPAEGIGTESVEDTTIIRGDNVVSITL